MFGALASICFAVGLVAATTSSAQTEDGVVIDNETITWFEIDQRSKLIQLYTRRIPLREEVIDELRDEKHKMRKAKDAGVAVSESEIDETYAAIGNYVGLTPSQMTQTLAQRGIQADTLKHRIRADIAWAKYSDQSVRDRNLQDPCVTRIDRRCN